MLSPFSFFHLSTAWALRSQGQKLLRIHSLHLSLAVCSCLIPECRKLFCAMWICVLLHFPVPLDKTAMGAESASSAYFFSALSRWDAWRRDRLAPAMQKVAGQHSLLHSSRSCCWIPWWSSAANEDRSITCRAKSIWIILVLPIPSGNQTRPFFSKREDLLSRPVF